LFWAALHYNYCREPGPRLESHPSNPASKPGERSGKVQIKETDRSSQLELLLFGFISRFLRQPFYYLVRRERRLVAGLVPTGIGDLKVVGPRFVLWVPPPKGDHWAPPVSRRYYVSLTFLLSAFHLRIPLFRDQRRLVARLPHGDPGPIDPPREGPTHSSLWVNFSVGVPLPHSGVQKSRIGGGLAAQVISLYFPFPSLFE